MSPIELGTTIGGSVGFIITCIYLYLNWQRLGYKKPYLVTGAREKEDTKPPFLTVRRRRLLLAILIWFLGTLSSSALGALFSLLFQRLLGN